MGSYVCDKTKNEIKFNDNNILMRWDETILSIKYISHIFITRVHDYWYANWYDK